MAEEDYRRRWAAFSECITHVVTEIMAVREMKQQDLARAMGYPQSGLSEVFSAKRKKRYWSGAMLLAAADALQVPVSYLFQAAESYEAIGADVLISVQVLGTNPQSKERATRIASLAAPPDISPDAKAGIYNADMMELVVPGLLKGYLEGVISDNALWDTLSRAIKEKKKSENFWAAVKRVC